MAVLVVPLPGRGCMAPRENAFDPDGVTVNQGLEEFFVEVARELAEEVAHAWIHAWIMAHL